MFLTKTTRGIYLNQLEFTLTMTLKDILVVNFVCLVTTTIKITSILQKFVKACAHKRLYMPPPLSACNVGK